MAEKTIERVAETNIAKYPSNTLKDYYDAIHELLEAIALIEGIKFSGDGAHERLINYVAKNYLLQEGERQFLQSLRDYRNKISYEGLFIDSDNLVRNQDKIKIIINKLRAIISLLF